MFITASLPVVRIVHFPQIGILNNTTRAAEKTGFKNATLERFSDFYLEDASFFRLDNINLGYTFRELAQEKLKLRVGAGVQNVFVITKYTGIDPEIAGGIDNNFFPPHTLFLPECQSRVLNQTQHYEPIYKINRGCPLHQPDDDILFQRSGYRTIEQADHHIGVCFQNPASYKYF